MPFPKADKPRPAPAEPKIFILNGAAPDFHAEIQRVVSDAAVSNI